jgi:LCP family protein required for cell wall assembly
MEINMNETNRKKKFRKVFRIVLIVLCSVILFLGGTISLVLHGYIRKLNIVTAKSDASLERADVEENLSEKEQMNSEPEETVVTQFNSAPVNNEADINQEEMSEEDAAIAAYLQSIKDNIDMETAVHSNSKVWNILLIGSDSRDTGSRGRSDSVILITLNKEAKEITATSFLRDIYLEIPGKGENRLNAAYAYGGPELLMDTLELNFKIKVDEYVKVDFFDFIDIIDALGGLTMDVSKEELEVMNGYIREMNTLLSQNEEEDFIKEAGTYHLNGKQVLAYSRNRYTKNGDFDRTDRQREIFQALLGKVFSLNPIELNNLLNTTLPQITTNITEGDILLQLISIPSYTEYEVNQFCIPVQNSFTNRRIRGMEVLCIDFMDNRRQLNSKLYHME